MDAFVKDLDLIGGVMGTDKSSADHNYLVHYDRLFRDHIALPFNFLEIGIFKGASLAMWREYFEQATIIGVDIQEDCRRYARDGVVVEVGSQDDPGFLADLVRRYPPKIIIDDGSHQAHHVIFSFETLFPSLEPGGIYVVEDLHFHAGAMRGHTAGLSGENPIDYFLALSRMLVSGELAPERNWGFGAYTKRMVDEITFFGKGVAVRKKAVEANRSARVAAALQYAEKDGTADAWERASRYLIGNGESSAAISAARRAIERAPSARLYLHLGQMLDAGGDRNAAIETLQLGAKIASDNTDRGYCLEYLGNSMISERRFSEGVTAFREALTLLSHPVVLKRIEDKIQQYERHS